MPQANAFGAPAADQPLISLAIERREPGPRDVSIEILYCGVCHSDLHTARGEWGQSQWPIVPGHEIVGRVSAAGAGVEKETGRMTAGGYSSAVVVDQDFVLRVSPDVDLAATAPLLCAGITTYSPLRHWNVGPESKVGVIGLGGP